MITIEQSYATGMSANDFYEQEQAALTRLIHKNGFLVHTFSRSGDSGVLCRGIELIGGFLLAEDGDICSPERWMRWDPPQPKRKPIKPSLRFEILKRDGYRCQMCGVTAKDGATLEIDHIYPISKGGTNDPSNLQVLCRDCNAGKGVQCQ
jgi:rubredoxin